LAAPTLISYTETSWTTTGLSKSIASISWQSGDVLVALGGSEGPDTLGAPTNTGSGLTWTSQKSNVAASTCGTKLATAVASASSSGVISMSSNNSSDEWGFAVWVWRGSNGVGNSAEQHTSTKTVALTPTGADSGIMWGVFDFAANSTLQTITPTPTNTRQRVNEGTHYTIYLADITDQVSAGAVSYGISGTGSGPFSILVMEVKSSGGASAFDIPQLGMTGVGF